MKFWDSSAVVPLLVPEAASSRLKHLYDEDPVVLAWWGTEVECVSAIVRRQRLGRLGGPQGMEAFSRLRALRRGWHEVEAGEEVREAAKRFLRVHDLRAADALQLAAAFFAAEDRPSTLEFVCLDARLVGAAQREGFITTPIPASRS
ncbi:MAG: type II toxin-antitoxin system VapC family toxin [Candidatus Rokuibacteriota bacterium]